MLANQKVTVKKKSIALFAVLIFLMLSACTKKNSNSGVDETIVFYANKSGNPDIFSLNLANDEITQLTENPAYDDSPALSPDGSSVLFLSSRNDPDPHFPDLKYDIYRMDINGKNLLQLTDTPQAEDHPAWSPDGTQILFDADYDEDGFYELYKMDVNGKNLTRLTFSEANDQFADWSPDGSQIAFSSDRNGNWDIYFMDADGNNQQQITDSADWELFPAWSPDEKWIAYNGLAPRSRNTDVFIMDAEGNNIRQLTDAPGFDENPVWTTSGEQILFQSTMDGNFNIYCINKDGSNLHAITSMTGDELWPSTGQ